MKKYIFYHTSDFEDKGNIFKKGQVYAMADEGNGLDGCAEIKLSQEQLDNIFDYLYIDGNLIYDAEGAESKRLEKLRAKRKDLLVAFDKYKTNVLLGLEEATALSDDISAWYRSILDLNEDAINNPPERIIYYQQGA